MQDNKTYSLHGIFRADTSRKSKTAGFTIVELLIVIVVIGILAAITIVAYNGIQQRARDTARKSDLAAIAKLLNLYKIDKGDFVGAGSGCGSGGNGDGFFNYQDGTSYPVSVMNCLKNAGYTNSTLIDPSGLANCNGLTCHAYMKYTCTQNGSVVTYVYANLEGLPHTASDTDGTCSGVVDSSYGMNYHVKVE